MTVKTQVDKFTIRKADEDDVPTILHFIHELAKHEGHLELVQATEETLRESLFVHHPAAEAIIGEYEGEPVAFAVFFHNFSTWIGREGLFLVDLYVSPDLRGRGLGKVMLSYLAKLARDRGCLRFEWRVSEDNTRAREFYKAMGAEPQEEWIIQRLSGEALDRVADGF